MREELPRWNFAKIKREDGSVIEVILAGLIKRRNAEI
jgi:hypothetical protein